MMRRLKNTGRIRFWVLGFGCQVSAIIRFLWIEIAPYYCFAKSLHFAKQIYLGQRFSEIPPLLEKGSCEEIEWREAMASFVVRGRGNFLPSKPGGRYMAMKPCPGFRRATSATCGNSNKSEPRILRASVGSIPSGPRRNKRLFWRQEIPPSPDIPRPPQFLAA
jgi:hypothetical protein